MFGYAGKLLFIDLTSGTIEEKDLPEEWAKNFVGGAALGARVLWEYMPKNTPVFDDRSMVGFVCGVFNNTPIFYGGRWTAVSKSPFNDGWNDANSGGYFGPALRKTGYDAVFVNGISEKPVYIYIAPGVVEIRDAEFLWGKTIPEFETALFNALGDDSAKYAAIGVSGENLAYSAAIMNDTHRAAARGGTAAVMGSKKLKAIVAHGGNFRVPVYDPERLLTISKSVQKRFFENPATKNFASYGTTANPPAFLPNGEAPVRNWGSSFEGAGFTQEDIRPIDGKEFSPRFSAEAWGCATCPTKCGAIMNVKEGPWPMQHVARPEYESCAMYSVLLMNKDIFSVVRSNELCNLYGADTITVAGIIAWAMECYNEGVFSKEDLDGIELTWGNSEAIVSLCEKIVKCEGCGRYLMNGSKWASEYYGKGEEYLVLAGGIEVPAHDPRRLPGWARSYYADPTPGRHVKGSLSIVHGGMTPEERFSDWEVTGFQDLIETGRLEFNNNSGICRFGMLMWMDRQSLYDLFPALTGFEMNDLSWYLMAMRSFTMRHIFNMREGRRRSDFSISSRLLGIPPLPDGENANHTVDVDRMVDNLYNALGYKKDGVPMLEMLKIVGGLDFAIQEFYPDSL